MSVRKERRIKAAMRPLIEDVQRYVESDENRSKITGLVGDFKLKVGARYDKIKKETQVIFTFVEKEVKARVKTSTEPDSAQAS